MRYSHEPKAAAPRKVSIFRVTVQNASCTTSSASDGLPVIRRASRYTRSPYSVTSASAASRSRRRSRSTSSPSGSVRTVSSSCAILPPVDPGPSAPGCGVWCALSSSQDCRYRAEERLGLERLGQKRGHPRPPRPRAHRVVPVRGEEDDGNPVAFATQPLVKLPAVHSGHAQIEDQAGRRLRFLRAQEFL